MGRNVTFMWKLNKPPEIKTYLICLLKNVNVMIKETIFGNYLNLEGNVTLYYVVRKPIEVIFIGFFANQHVTLRINAKISLIIESLSRRRAILSRIKLKLRD